jgi:hypothetical protein|tara:strand:- start:1103 stop:1225 length:123 start_codon:yes stop_codon:yes gene_type:complete
LGRLCQLERLLNVPVLHELNHLLLVDSEAKGGVGEEEAGA